MPPEESADLRAALHAQHLDLVPFVAPTSPRERIRTVAAQNPVFVYCVALVGVTGARQDVSAALDEFLGHVRAEIQAPLVVGFGISHPDHVRRVARLGAAGVIVASALTDLVEQSANPVEAARTYLREMKNVGALAG
jgi:tryptophan synthase alpha chain